MRDWEECYSFSTAVSVAECGERIARESDESQTKLKFGIETSPDRSVFTLRLRESEKVHIRKAECEREREAGIMSPLHFILNPFFDVALRKCGQKPELNSCLFLVQRKILVNMAGHGHGRLSASLHRFTRPKAP